MKHHHTKELREIERMKTILELEQQKSQQNLFKSLQKQEQLQRKAAIAEEIKLKKSRDARLFF